VSPRERLGILHVLAGYRSSPHGGSVLYPLSIASRQAPRHRVSLFAADADPLAPPYRVADGEIEGVPARRVLKPGLGRHDACVCVEDRALDAPFASWLDARRPDVVHFHAITGLSSSLPAIAAAQRLAVVFTLHDLTAVCPTGTMMRPGGTPCPGPEPGACRRCLGDIRYLPPARAALLQRLLAAAPPAAARAALRAASRARAPIARLLARRGPDHEGYLGRRASSVREALGLAHRILAPSRYLVEGHAPLGLDPRRIEVRPLGISPPTLERRTVRTGGPVVLGYFGSVRKRKGAHLLVRAFATLPAGSARLVVRGAPEAAFVDVLRRDWPANALLGGRYDPADLGALLREHEVDAIVLPSLGAEGFPLAVQEAFAAGLPVVTSDVGGQAEVVRHEVDGLLFRAGDADDLARALRRLVLEPGLLARLSAGISRPLTADEDAAGLESIYEQVVREARRGDPVSA
jgi:glycosyltransferase involved in cell wall biosynthesis